MKSYYTRMNLPEPVVPAVQALSLLKGQTAYRKGVFSSTWYSPRANGWLLAFRATGGVMSPFGTVPRSTASVRRRAAGPSPRSRPPRRPSP